MAVKYVNPTFYLLSEPKLHWQTVKMMLHEIYGMTVEEADRYVLPRMNSNPDCDLNGLTEIMARLCYRSFQPGLNPNVIQVRQDQSAHIANLLAVHHMAVFEHVHVSWVFSGVSRVFTHELVRHRLADYSQESLRYVRLDQELPFRATPLPTEMNRQDVNLFASEADRMLQDQHIFVQAFVNLFGLDKPDATFGWKKTVTSMLRRWVGMGVASTIGCTWNIPMLRHIIEQRTAPEAEEEIRGVFRDVARLCINRWPLLFGDFREMPSGRFRAIPPVDEELVMAWLQNDKSRQKIVDLLV